MALHKKTFSVDVDEKLQDEFAKIVERGGFIKYRAIEAAMRVFNALPLEIQSKLMSSPKDVPKLLCDYYRDRDSVSFLDSLTPGKREKALQALKALAKEISPKA